MKISLIGNPNSGKSTLFNALTGARQRVGNWPGVTVERKIGKINLAGQDIEIVDLPGTYAIESLDVSVSQDEMVTREFVINEKDNLIINIVDATNLQRSLYLTFQLLDLARPMIVVLNMIDALEELGETINIEQLAQQLGCPVIAISASKKKGLSQLHQIIQQSLANPILPKPLITTLGDKTETVIQHYLSQLHPDSMVHTFNRWVLIELLLDDSNSLISQADAELLSQCRKELSAWCDNEIDVALASSRYEAIDQLTKQVIDKPREASLTLSDKLDRFTLGRFTGIPFFLVVMYIMFIVAVKFGSVFIDFFDILFNTIFVQGVAYLLQMINAPEWLEAILAQGIGSGIQTVATFIPVIAAMFFCLSFLEDSGYLARAAMVVDRGMRTIGLPGKAFVPMLIGFGCGVPAIMGTRTLDSVRDRLMSLCMIPFMSCGARLPVYTLFAVIFFPHNASTVVFALYLLGIVIAIVTGIILKQTILPGTITPFIMELPAYRIPTLRGMIHLTWSRLKSFIFRAGKAIVLMVTVLSLFNSFGTDGSFGHSDSDDSVLTVVSQKLTPVFEPMGVSNQNWPATVGIFTGIFAKEAVIATLNSLYSMESQDDDKDDSFNFINGVTKALESIPTNLVDLTDSFLDPLGLTAVDEDMDEVQKDLEISAATVSKIETSFGHRSAAFAYLIFILLYTPCAAALGAVYREAGLRWTVFVGGWTFFIGWILATAYYQYTLLADTPTARYWLSAIAMIFIIVLLIMKLVGRFVHANQIKMKKTAECGKDCCC